MSEKLDKLDKVATKVTIEHSDGSVLVIENADKLERELLIATTDDKMQNVLLFVQCTSMFLAATGLQLLNILKTSMNEEEERPNKN